MTRSQIKLWIEAGAVTVNGKSIRKAGFALKPEAEIDVAAPPAGEVHLEPFSFPLSIIAEDEEIVVLNKPAGIAVHPGAGSGSKTLLNALLHHLGATEQRVERYGIVHRLDKDTSGVWVVAKNNRAHHLLSAQFAERSVKKIYRALAFSPPRRQLPDQGRVDEPIGRHPTRRTEMAVIAAGRPAITGWQVCERMPWACLVEARPESGRTHQIRVHFKHLRHHLIGDPVYGEDRLLPLELRRAAEQFGRQALHAYSLEFSHPLSQKRVSYIAPLPDDFSRLIEVFRRES